MIWDFHYQFCLFVFFTLAAEIQLTYIDCTYLRSQFQIVLKLHHLCEIFFYLFFCNSGVPLICSQSLEPKHRADCLEFSTLERKINFLYRFDNINGGNCVLLYRLWYSHCNNLTCFVKEGCLLRVFLFFLIPPVRIIIIFL